MMRDPLRQSMTHTKLWRVDSDEQPFHAALFGVSNNLLGNGAILQWDNVE